MREPLAARVLNPLRKWIRPMKNPMLYKLLPILLVSLISGAPSFGAFSHDYTSEFSLSNGNPNGVWLYQSVGIAGANSTATNMQEPDTCCGGGFWHSTLGDTFSLDGQQIFHPGVNNDS